MGELFQPEHLLILGLILALFPIVILPPYWMIFKKAGFSPWLTLLMLVPVVNLLVLYIVAFSQWRVVPAPPQQNWPMQSGYPPTYPPPV